LFLNKELNTQKSQHFVKLVYTELFEGKNSLSRKPGQPSLLTEQDPQQRMALHLQNTPLGVIECDNNSCVTEWNLAAEAIFGFKKVEVLGRNVSELIIPENIKPTVTKTWDKVLDSRSGVQSVNENMTKSGSMVICQWYNTPLINNADEIIGVASIVQDVTKQLEAQKKLEESEASYRTLFELSDEAIMTLDMAKETFVDCNEATLKLFGYTQKSQFLKLHPGDVSPPYQSDGSHSRQAAEQAINIALNEGKNHFEWTHLHVNGECFDAEVSLKPMVLQGRQVLQAIVRDISERKKAEAILLAAKQEAERANLAKSEFLSRMSHELRTPLNAILGFGQLLEMTGKTLNETQQGNVREILSAGYYLLNLINELLDMAKIEAGKLKLTIEAVELDELMTQCIPMVTRQAQKHQLKMIDEIGNKGFVVDADHVRLKQVLLNLLSNAIKYNHDNGTVTITAEVIEARLRIYVTDTGAGLTQAQIDKLFIPFERLNEVGQIEGTGIGLTISKHLMDRMGGSIGVQSTVGTGSSFWLELELNVATGAENQ
jgi:PAS domain S-box-containing protein